MKLSIIVPVYNMASGGRLTYCLDSLVNQELTDYEIIAVDDASTDASPVILGEYRSRYPELFKVILSEKNGKQGAAKNLGLESASGDWIGFIDSDDWVTPDYYKRMIELAEATGADLVGCDYQLTSEHSMSPGTRVPNNLPEQSGVLDHDKWASLILDSGSLCTKIFSRHIIFDYPNRFPEGIFYEDNAIANSWMLRARHFEYIPEAQYYYYQHGDSTVHTVTEERCRHRMEAGRLMLLEAREFGFFEEYKNELEFSFTQLFYINTLFSYMYSAKKTDLAFVAALGEEMKKTFPGFRSNPYYQERIDAEEKRLIDMHMSSPIKFYFYYKALWAYRHLRYGKKK